MAHVMPMRNARSASPRDLHFFRAAMTAFAGLAMVYVFASGRIPCATARVLHVPCPGCGSTRAVTALLSGDLTAVLHENPLGPIMALFVLGLGAQAVVSMLRGGTFAQVGEGPFGRFLTRGLVVVAVLEVGLWIVRFFGLFGGPVSVA